MPSATVEKFVLHGHVVTMNDHSEVIARGAVYVSGDSITAVQDATAPAPAGFANAKIIDTKGTIFPGLIELHNHLSYDALRLWKVPQKYGNRDEWPKHPEYHQLVTGPMSALGKAGRPELLAALVRYVESKCLFGGVTTSQGIALASNAGVQKFYKGVVRNVESSGIAALKSARTHIADVEARDWDKFFAAISEERPLILHLSEGKDQKAREHFLALQNGTKWAITDRLLGIHCAGMNAEDFSVLAKHGGAMVWSPFSNYLLYGDTADVVGAKKAGVLMAIGSDWSPSGSKNLLGELKVARLAADATKVGFTDHDIVAMATCNPAKMLKWDSHVGSLAAGKRADILVIDKAGTDGYKALLAAHEDDIALVVIDGVARYGTPAFMEAAEAESTAVKVAGVSRHVQYHDPAANPDIDSLSLATASETLKTFFADLPHAGNAALAREPDAVKPTTKATKLVLDEDDTSVAQRHLLPYKGHRTGWTPADPGIARLAKPALVEIGLDPLTVKDDDAFVPAVLNEMNLPGWLKEGLKKAF